MSDSHILNTIDCSLPYREQFIAIKDNGNYGDEQPQVELFCDLLKTIDSTIPSMIELGSGGVHASFYSILFEKWFHGRCKIINTEPRKELIDAVGVLWKDRHLVNAKLYHGYTGIPMHFQTPQQYNDDITPKLSMSYLFEDNHISGLDILHFDIQGSETSVCEELEKENLFPLIRYIFISTHQDGNGKGTHEACKKILSDNMNCLYHFDDPTRGGCGDGLIVVENKDWRNL